MELPPEMESALEQIEPQLRQLFLQAVQNLTSQIQINVIVSHLQAGRISDALVALNLDPLFFAPIDRAISDAYYKGGVMALANLPKIPDPFSSGAIVINFDARAIRAENWVKKKSSDLIEGIIEEEKESLREVLRQGLEDGRNPRNVALEISGRVDLATGKRTGGLLGLNSQQKTFVRTARQQLSSEDPAELAKYFDRKMRDRRYDSIVQKALDGGKKLTQAQVDSITSRYSDRLLKLRADTISRTEGINALRAGQYEGYKQLVESGAVQESQVARTWQATGDKRTRHDHMAMHGQKVQGLSTPFRAPDNSELLFPGDVSLQASADQIINCRCFMKVRISYLG